MSWPKIAVCITKKEQRAVVRKTARAIRRIDNLVEKAQDIWNDLPDNVKDALVNSQVGNTSFSHCLRWLATGCHEYKEFEINEVLREEGVI